MTNGTCSVFCRACLVSILQKCDYDAHDLTKDFSLCEVSILQKCDYDSRPIRQGEGGTMFQFYKSAIMTFATDEGCVCAICFNSTKVRL